MKQSEANHSDDRGSEEHDDSILSWQERTRIIERKNGVVEMHAPVKKEKGPITPTGIITITSAHFA